MHPLTTFLVLVCFVAYFGNVSAKIGDFVDHNGYTCAFDVSKKGYCNDLQIKCGQHYSCVYSGYPYKCSDYTSDKTHKLEWGYVKILSKNAEGACAQRSVTMKEMCAGVKFKKGVCKSRPVLEEIIFKKIEYNGY